MSGPVVRVRPTARPFAAAPAPADGALAVRRHGSPRRDSRIGVALPAGERWSVRWRAPLPTLVEPVAILGGGARAVVQGKEMLAIYDGDGALVGQRAFEPDAGGDLQLDVARDLVLSSTREGFVVAWRLADAREAWRCGTNAGLGFARDLLVAQGDRLLLTSRAVPRGWREQVPAAVYRLEAVDLGTPFAVEEGFVVSSETAAEAALPVRGARSAASSTALVVATTGRLHVFDTKTLDERVVLELEDPELVPLALSLDEADRIWLVAQPSEDALGPRPSLQLITPEGERVFFFELEGLRDAPPVIGFEHRAHVVAGGQLHAYEPTGDLAWKTELAPAGLTALPGGVLLAAAGPELRAFDAKGASRTLATFEGERLAAAPVVTAAGEILAVTDAALYALKVRA